MVTRCDIALARMRTALDETLVEGINTNIPLHRELMVDAKFMAGGTNIHYLEEWACRSQALMVELRLMCPEARVETLCEALDALDALSVSVEDADAQTDAEQALFGEPGMPPPKEGWQRSRVVALFASQETAQETGKLLALQGFLSRLLICWAFKRLLNKTGCV